MELTERSEIERNKTYRRKVDQFTKFNQARRRGINGIKNKTYLTHP